MVCQADGGEGAWNVAARIVGIRRLFRPGAVFIFNGAGRVRIEMRLS
jgi:hypothetical protein